VAVLALDEWILSTEIENALSVTFSIDTSCHEHSHMRLCKTAAAVPVSNTTELIDDEASDASGCLTYTTH